MHVEVVRQLAASSATNSIVDGLGPSSPRVVASRMNLITPIPGAISAARGAGLRVLGAAARPWRIAASRKAWSAGAANIGCAALCPVPPRWPWRRWIERHRPDDCGPSRSWIAPIVWKFDSSQMSSSRCLARMRLCRAAAEDRGRGVRPVAAASASTASMRRCWLATRNALGLTAARALPLRRTARRRHCGAVTQAWPSMLDVAAVDRAPTNCCAWRGASCATRLALDARCRQGAEADRRRAGQGEGASAAFAFAGETHHAGTACRASEAHPQRLLRRLAARHAEPLRAAAGRPAPRHHPRARSRSACTTSTAPRTTRWRCCAARMQAALDAVNAGLAADGARRTYPNPFRRPAFAAA